MSVKNQEFIIKFEGVNLSKEASERIQRGVNELLLQELAGSGAGAFSDGADGNYCGVYIPHKWIGRQVLVANLNRLGELTKTEGKIAFIAPTLANQH